MRLVELTERPSSIIMVHRARKNGFPFINRLHRSDSHDRVGVAFKAYSQLGRVLMRSTTAISSLSTMHEDICNVAEKKRVAMVILPFHKQWRGEGDEVNENMGHGWRGVNQRVLKHSPCSVAVLVDRGFGIGPHQTPASSASVTHRICILFFGGPDDREALKLGARMAEHPAVRVTTICFVEEEVAGVEDVILRPSQTKSSKEQNYRFSTAKMDRRKEKELDESATAEFKSRCGGLVKFVEKVASNVVVEVLAIGGSGEYDLVVVGMGRFPTTMVAKLADRQAEHAELGPIGDILSGPGIVSSVLVVQQYDIAHAEEVPVSKVLFHSEDATASSSVGPSTKEEVTHDFV